MRMVFAVVSISVMVSVCAAQTGPIKVGSTGRDGLERRVTVRIACDQLTIACPNPTPHHFNAWWLLPIAATAALIPADKHVAAQVPHGSAEVSRDLSNVGLYGSVGTLGVLGAWGLAKHSSDDEGAHRARETALLGAEALANSGAVYLLTNVIAGRERPLTGSGNGLFWKDHATNTSFPSGHATMTFAVDTVIAHEYPGTRSRVLWYSVATGTAVMRVLGQKHFPADVVAGGTLGFWFGRHIFKAYHER